jgi:hypothetical protein
MGDITEGGSTWLVVGDWWLVVGGWWLAPAEAGVGGMVKGIKIYL